MEHMGKAVMARRGKDWSRIDWRGGAVEDWPGQAASGAEELGLERNGED